MNSFAPRITTIKGISEKRRLPRLGYIRLGVKIPNKDADPKRCECKGIGCFRCTHPLETPWFICPPEIEKIYKEKPTEIDVMVPINDLGIVFPQAYKWYGSSRGVKCTGNLEIAYRVNEETRTEEQIECPCEHYEVDCTRRGSLKVIVWKVNFGGIYEIRSTSFNSFIDVNSGLAYTEALIGRFAMVPLKLRRVKTETHHKGKKQIHYPLKINLETNSPEFINALREQTQKILTGPQYALPPAEDVRPDLEGPIVSDWKEEEEAGNSPVAKEEPAGRANGPKEDERARQEEGIVADSVPSPSPPAPAAERQTASPMPAKKEDRKDIPGPRANTEGEKTPLAQPAKLDEHGTMTALQRSKYLQKSYPDIYQEALKATGIAMAMNSDAAVKVNREFDRLYAAQRKQK